ncbi:MAG: phosphoglucosamine mutase, partial [Cyclobacteriaceae bacterium]|nr:phosphoglucosamine mutase [Cyclobacteriaceae bacterium]
MALIKSISGIRGTIGGVNGENLTPMDVVKFTSAYGYWIIKNNKPKKVVVGRDARISGSMVQGLVNSTLSALGIDVIDIGLSTTPTVEIAVPIEKAGGGIIITASHNPVQWNALKLLNEKGEFVSSQDGEDILKIAESGEIVYSDVLKLGKIEQKSGYIEKHIEQVLNYPLVNKDLIEKAGFRILVDAVNSTGGITVPQLLKALGVHIIDCMDCEPTGHFSHNPEPLPENLTHIISEMEKGQHDLGIVVDPDVDRLVLICEDGTPFGEEYTLVAIADYFLKNVPGPTVSNMSSSRALHDVSIKHGQSYAASAVGEVNVVEKMKANKAVIGGEGNGGIIVPDFHYGRDALIGIALFLTTLTSPTA